MRRSLIIGLTGLVLAVLAWWFWSSRQTIVSPETVTVTTITNFSSLSSPAFAADGKIPEKYTCDGENINPPLSVGGLPPVVKYLAITLDDPSAQNGVFDHWVVWDIPRRTGTIEEDLKIGVLGNNSNRKAEYYGPCPPNGEHRYRFRIWGYTVPLALPAESSKNELLKKLDGRAIISAEFFGRYNR